MTILGRVEGLAQKVEGLVDGIRFGRLKVVDRSDAPRMKVVEAGGGLPERKTGREPWEPRVSKNDQMTGFIRE